MDARDTAWQEQRLEEILYSDADNQHKSQQIIRLGFEPETADELVSRQQQGSRLPDYFETLDFDEYDPDDAAAQNTNNAPA